MKRVFTILMVALGLLGSRAVMAQRKSVVLPNSESYYVVGLVGYDGAYGTPYLRMDQVSATQYQLLIPARYPLDIDGLRNQLWSEGANELSNQKSQMVNTINGKFSETGAKFLIAKGSALKDAIEKYQTNSESYYSTLLAPDVTATNSDGNVWVGDKNTVTGKLKTYQGNPTSAGGQWEIRTENGKATLDDTEVTEQYSISNPENGKVKFVVPTQEYLNKEILNGAYLLTIDVANNTWSMEYRDGVHVTYIFEGYTSDRNPNHVDATYTLVSRRSYDSSKGTYGWSEYVGDVYFDTADNYWYGILANWNADMSGDVSHRQIYEGMVRDGMTLEEAYADPHLNYQAWSSHLMTYGAEDDFQDLLPNYSPALNDLSRVKDANGNPVTVPEGLQGSGNSCCSTLGSIAKYNGQYGVHFYANLGNASNSQGKLLGVEAPEVASVWINPGKGNSETPNALKGDYPTSKTEDSASPYKLTYDKVSNTWVTTLTSDEFQNGSFYFDAVDKDGKTIDNFEENADKNTNPSAANPNYVGEVKGSVHDDRKDNIYTGAPSDYTGKYKIYFQEVPGNTTDDNPANDATSYKYWIEIAKETDIVVTSSTGVLIQTYSNDVDMRKPVVTLSDGTKAEVNVYGINGFDTKTEGDITYTTVKTVSMDYIPANTGVLLWYDVPEDKSVKGEMVIKSMETADYEGKSRYQGINYLEPAVYARSVYNKTTDEYSDYILAWAHYTKSWKEGKLGARDYLGFFTANGWNAANKAYLHLTADMVKQINSSQIGNSAENANSMDASYQNDKYTTSAAAKSYVVYMLGNGNATGINKVSETTAAGNDGYYTLNGIKVSSPKAGGIYIHNGKKVLILKK